MAALWRSEQAMQKDTVRFLDGLTVQPLYRLFTLNEVESMLNQKPKEIKCVEVHCHGSPIVFLLLAHCQQERIQFKVTSSSYFLLN